MKKRYTLGLAMGLMLSPFVHTKAQITQGGNPRSIQKPVPQAAIPEIRLGGIDEDKLRAEDAQRALLGKEFNRRFGYTFDVQYNLDNAGVWTALPNGDRIWQLTLSSEAARSINLTFSKYYMPAGADLFLIGAQNKIGALTAFNNQADEKLGTGLIYGSWVTLEYYEPLAVRGLGKIEIGKATHGYKNPNSTLEWGDSDACEMNVNCPQGQPWQNEKRAVARIIDNGDVCTGTLVNNVLQDGKPYFLTANHCYSASSTTWVFSFNWEAPACATPSTPIPEDETISGSTLKARNAKSDFCLFELSSKPPASFKAYYAGWNADPAAATNSTFIHHPAGDIKKISFDTQAPTSSGYGVGSTNDNSHWQIGNYEFGTTTEGGSSGCPMFDHNHLIVGQLHGGPASCTNIAQDFYGKFSMSWAEGTTPATRLKDWLDPTNTGLVTVLGMDPDCKKIIARLPFRPAIDTVTHVLPYLWKVKNPDADSTFRLVQGGFNNPAGKALRMVAENFDPSGRADTLVLSPVSVSNYKKLRINYKYAYRRKAANLSDTLRLLVSQDCGQTFKTLGSWAGAQFITDLNTGSATPFMPADTLLWRNMETALDSTYNRAEQLVFGFLFSSGNAGTLWLDEFRVIGDTAKNKPLTRFEANRKSGCVGTQVQFADSTLFNPASWAWTFEGGSPATSTQANPQVTYNTVGNFKVTLITTNEEGSDTLEETSFVQIFQLGTTTTPFLQNLSAAGAFPPAGYLLLNPENNVTWTKNNNVTAPGSPGGSLMFDNYSNPDVSGQTDLLALPTISTAGKNHLKLRLQMAYKYLTIFGQVAPDTLTIGYTRGCGGTFYPLWKRGGMELATAGNSTSSYTPIDADWAPVALNLDSLLAYPEISIGFENLFGYGNRIFIDDIKIDTIDNCPATPVITVNSDSMCVGKQLVLSMDSLEGATYSWTGPSNFSASARVATRTITGITHAGIYRGTKAKDGCSSPMATQNIAVFANPNTPTFTQTGNNLTGPNNMANYVWIVNGTDTLDVHTRTITAPYSGSYVLVVYNAGGCTRASNPVNVIVSHVAGFQINSGLKAVPNPTTGLFTILSPTGAQGQVEGIYNAVGQNMIRQIPTEIGSTSIQIDLKNLPSGCYWVKLAFGKHIQTIPVLKN